MHPLRVLLSLRSQVGAWSCSRTPTFAMLSSSPKCSLNAAAASSPAKRSPGTAWSPATAKCNTWAKPTKPTGRPTVTTLTRESSCSAWRAIQPSLSPSSTWPRRTRGRTPAFSGARSPTKSSGILASFCCQEVCTLRICNCLDVWAVSLECLQVIITTISVSQSES